MFLCVEHLAVKETIIGEQMPYQVLIINCKWRQVDFCFLLIIIFLMIIIILFIITDTYG